MIKLKDIIKESKWADRNWGDPLPTLEDYMTEAESMKLQPKGGGKTVTFKDKDNYEKAKKSGDYEDPEGSGDGGEKEEPSGKLGVGDFERDTDTTRGDPDDSWDDDEGKPKPSGGDFTKSADYDMWSDDDPDAKQKGMDRASGLAKKGMEKSPEDMSDDELETADNDLRQKSNHLMSRAMGGDDTRSTAYSGGTPSDKEWAELGKQSKAVKKEKQKRAAGGDTDTPKKSDKGSEVTKITKNMNSIASSGGNNVLLAKGTVDHIAKHNKPGEGSVFSDDISMDDVQNAISEIPEEFYEKGGGVHTTTVPNAGYNLVQKASDIKKDHPNAKKIMVKKQVGYDRDKKEPIMKEVPAYIIDDDKEKFKTDQLSVVVRPSNPDFMDDEVKNNSDVKKDLDGKKSHSVLTSFPGDPDVPTADKWEESGHAIIIPNGGKDADKTNWVTDLAKKGVEKRPGGEQAEKDYQKADQMIKKYAGRDIEKAEFWAKKKKQASDAMMGEITINSKQYKIISESINSTVFDPKGEIKSFWNRIKDK